MKFKKNCVIDISTLSGLDMKLPKQSENDTENTTINTAVVVDALDGDDDPDGDNANMVITEIFDPVAPAESPCHAPINDKCIQFYPLRNLWPRTLQHPVFHRISPLRQWLF